MPGKISSFRLVLATGLLSLSAGVIASAGTVTVTNQIRTDQASVGSVAKSNTAPDNGAFNDTTTATSGDTTATASQKSSFGVVGSNFETDVTLGAGEEIEDGQSNSGMPSFELDFAVSAASAYTFNGSTNLMYNGAPDPTGFYTGMNLALLEGATPIFRITQGQLTSDPQNFAYNGTLAPGSYTLDMSLDSGGAGGNIQGSLDGTLTIANGSVTQAVPLPPAAATVLMMLGALALLKLAAGNRMREQNKKTTRTFTHFSNRTCFSRPRPSAR
jgi:hypothetical protein